jgi:hypothetical protein
LVFFYYRLPLFDIVTIPFFIFIFCFIALSIVNYRKYWKFWSTNKSENVTKKEKPDV